MIQTPTLALLLLLTQATAQPSLLVFTHVTVIDATGAPAKFNQAVVINGNRITKLGETGKVHIPKDANVVNATGKFLIPGL
jgi:imidazolonepropionase-like amidohydrolase